MISCNIRGGLGNYLFQIAAPFALALRNNDKAVFPKAAVQVHNSIDFYLDNILRNVEFVDEVHHGKIFRNFNFAYKPIKYEKNLLLEGYFPSPKYFGDFKKEILELYSIDDKSSQYILQKYPDLFKQTTCSIHVRRGDYLKVSHFNKLDLEYYNKARSMMPKDTQYLVFSDDIEWCKLNFKGDTFTFIENEKDYIDLYLMSMCTHNIIANSTFSWWAAYMNKHENKMVIGPKIWFLTDRNLQTDSLFEDSWKRI